MLKLQNYHKCIYFMRKIVILLTILLQISALPCSAVKRPDKIPPPPEERRFVGHAYLDPKYATFCRFEYPAYGYFFWVCGTVYNERHQIIEFTCHNPVRNGAMSTVLMAIPAYSYSDPGTVITGGSYAWIEEYENWDQYGNKFIKTWNFSARFQSRYEYVEGDEVVFYLYDDIDENDPPIIV